MSVKKSGLLVAVLGGIGIGLFSGNLVFATLLTVLAYVGISVLKERLEKKRKSKSTKM